MNPPSESAHEHETTWSLLPWYLNGTLTDEEVESVREHLARCVSCRAEAEEQETLRQHIAATDSRPEHAPAAFAALEQRIDSQPASFGGRSLWSGALRLAAILAVAIGIWTATRPNEFVVLADPSACTGDLSIVFSQQATAHAIEQLLEREGLAISCGASLTAPGSDASSADRLYKVRLIEAESSTDRIGAEALATRLSDLEIVQLALAAND